MLSAGEWKDRSPAWMKAVANRTTRAHGLATVSWRSGPDFLVIGCKRGGTTSLFNYLLMHPAVCGLFPQSRGKKSTDHFFADSAHGTAWYRSHFPTSVQRRRLTARTGSAVAAGEASPYYVWDPRIAARVHAVAPQVRAVLLLRDPVERAWSHYQERRGNGVEPLSFRDALDAEESRLDGELDRMLADPSYHSTAHDWYSYRSRGIYLPQIRNWLEVFSREQLLVVRSEDLYADVQALFDQVCDFLGVVRHRLPSTRPFNASDRSSTLDPAIAEELRSFYAPHNRELEQWWGGPPPGDTRAPAAARPSGGRRQVGRGVGDHVGQLVGAQGVVLPRA